MKHLYFIRHGLSEFNKAHKWAGSSDTPLAPEGHVQAKLAGENAKKQGLAFDIILSSPLKRAHDTALYVATEVGYPHDAIVLDERLIERKFGALEGRKDLIASTKYVLDESAIDKYEGVERLVDLQKRADEVLDHVYSLSHDTVLIVGHGAFGRALRRSIKNDPLHIRGKPYENAILVKLI